MKKLMVNLNTNLSRFFYSDSISAINQKLECPVDKCNGFISLSLSQRFSGAGAICNKCHRTVIFKESEC